MSDVFGGFPKLPNDLGVASDHYDGGKRERHDQLINGVHEAQIFVVVVAVVDAHHGLVVAVVKAIHRLET